MTISCASFTVNFGVGWGRIALHGSGPGECVLQ